MRHKIAPFAVIAVGVILEVAVMTAAVSAMTFGAWSQPQNLEAVGADDDLNTIALEGCPSISRDGLSMYFASNRLVGGYGGIDIYVSSRSSVDDPWGAPVNLGPTVNTAANELCPTPMRDGHGLMFVSSKPGGCGGWDIYATRWHVTRGWGQPNNIGCTVNSSADEASPFLVGEELYFSSTRTGVSHIYVAPVTESGSIGTPTLAPGLNATSADARPNLGRDGLEIFFDSNRSGGCGGLDLWTSTRASTSDQWAPPIDLGCDVNGSANDLRPSISWDGTHLYFGSDRTGGEGSQDLYGTTRERVPANGESA